MRLNFTVAAWVIIPVFSAAVAQAAPVFTVTTGTASYANSVLGSTLGNSFSFSGMMVSIMGSGGNNVGFNQLESLNVPFNFSIDLAIDDDGDESGPASAGGIDYASVQYLGDAAIHSSSPIVLTAGNLTVSVPATVSGLLSACNPSNICAFGGGVPDHVFDVDFAVSGTLTVTYALFNPPVGTQYALTTATFTPAVPEPSVWILVLGALGFGICIRRLAPHSSRVA